MRLQFLGSATAIVAAGAIAAGPGGLVFNTTASNASTSVAEPENSISANEASRFAKQASFGPTQDLIDNIVAKKSLPSWIDDQFNLSDSSYADISNKTVPSDYCAKLTESALAICNRANFSATPVQMRFYSNAISGSDQVRQRVAFALSQIIVASETKVHTTAGLAGFEQIFLSNAFGNYRDIIKAVTLDPFMGDYLNMADSNKIQPNENYARELMQLFSVGTVLLNPDGTPQTDSAGATIPTYSNADVREVARALTGWTWARINNAPPSDYNNRDWSKPMVTYASRFDTTSKTFLGKTIAANATQEANVDAVVDAVFNHPNTAPYVSKRLIQQLTLANPSPAYVGRVATVFANNGSGVRGDMKAVIRAIYLDSEARTVSQLPGKVKEPVLLATSLARAIGFTTDGWTFLTRDAGMGQSPFQAPSVFNYYSYSFPLPMGSGISSPVSQLMTTSSVVLRHNFVYDWTIGGDETRSEFQPQPLVPKSSGSTPNWASWTAKGIDDYKTIDRINLIMLNGTMTETQRQALLNAMGAIKHPDASHQARRRAQLALYIVASSPFFQVDR